MEDRYKNKCKYYNNLTPLFISRHHFFHIVDRQSNVLEDSLLFSLFAFLFLVIFLFFYLFFFVFEEVNYENEVRSHTYSRTYSQII